MSGPFLALQGGFGLCKLIGWLGLWYFLAAEIESRTYFSEQDPFQSGRNTILSDGEILHAHPPDELVDSKSAIGRVQKCISPDIRQKC